MMDLTAAEVAAATRGRWLATPPSFMAVGVGIDSREDLARRLFVAIRGERHDGHHFIAQALARGAVAAIVERSPAGDAPPRSPTAEVDPTQASCLLVGSTRGALADLARVTRSRFSGRVAAVTGSCGKTTTRRLLAAILEQQGPTVQSPKSFNNDLGVPLTVLALRPHHRALVSEIGMSAPGEIEPLAQIVRPHAAIITMVGHAHIEALGSVQAIAVEKASITAALEPDGVVIVPAEQEVVRAAVHDVLARSGRAASTRCLTFGRGAGDARLVTRRAVANGSEIEIAGPWGVLAVSLGLPGEHNAMNALAAALAAHALGATPDAMRDGLACVRPAEMRFVRERLGTIMVSNDAYNANPEAMRASISAFAEAESGAARRVTVLGDMLELGHASRELHAELGEWLATAFEGGPPSLAVFVGQQSEAGAGSFARAAPAAACLHLPDTSAESAARLAMHVRPGDALLVKASRGSAIERLMEALAARIDARDPSAGALTPEACAAAARSSTP